MLPRIREEQSTAITRPPGPDPAEPTRPDGDDGSSPSRVASWRQRSFGPASEQPYRRRTSDWIRFAVGVGALIDHQGHPTQFEKNLFETVNGLPNDLASVFRLLYRFGALWALAIIVVAALLARRWRLARDLAIGGAVTWVLARLIGALVVDQDGVKHGIDVVTRIGHASPDFPAVRLAVIVSVISVASPYLTRPVR